MNEKLTQALDYVDDAHIVRAAKYKKRKKLWIPAVAALLALVFFWHTPTIPLAVSARAVSLAPESRATERPGIAAKQEAFDAWYEERMARNQIIDANVGAIGDFCRELSQKILPKDASKNQVWSPVNAYIGLAMTAELTGSHTRENILNVLNSPDVESLRSAITSVWESLYADNGREVCTLANSLWLDNRYDYHQTAMDALAYHYYASVYQGDLGSDAMNKAITNWLDNNTGGLLKDRTGKVALDPDTSCMALASTVYFQGQWADKFDEEKNTEEAFQSPTGDVTATYMNRDEVEMNYYWAEDFGAVQLGLRDNVCMWFFLPDEDKTIDDVLSSEAYMTLMTNSDRDYVEQHSKYMKVNLSIPKFDITAGVDLKESLTELGMGELFQVFGNDFSPSIDTQLPVFIDQIHQNTRVSIDETGVAAASYILIEFGAGAAMPPEEIIDFNLDRPFVFSVVKQNIPMFMGTVNDPTQ